MGSFIKILPKLLGLILSVILALSCNTDKRSASQKLLEELDILAMSAEKRSIFIHHTLDNAVDEEDRAYIKTWLLSYVDEHPQDPFNSSYIYTLAVDFFNLGQQALALLLLEELIYSYTDIITSSGESIHYLALSTLSKFSSSPEQQVFYISKILNSNAISLGAYSMWEYRLATALEKTGEWDEAMSLYARFVSEAKRTVPETPAALSNARTKLDIYNSKRNWYTDPSLNSLINKIKYAIKTRSTGLISYYQANDFFTLSSNYANTGVRADSRRIYLTNFISDAIRFGDLIPESNSREAWLISYNWSFFASTWYFNFKRIDYPADPSIHNNWQWTGVYFGNFF